MLLPRWVKCKSGINGLPSSLFYSRHEPGSKSAAAARALYIFIQSHEFSELIIHPPRVRVRYQITFKGFKLVEENYQDHID